MRRVPRSDSSIEGALAKLVRSKAHESSIKSIAVSITMWRRRLDMSKLWIPLVAFALATEVVAARPVETVTPAFAHAIGNIPGKSLVAVTVAYPPNGASPAHSHAPSAFIFAYVLDGEIRSSVNGSPVRIYRKGESWYEPPGAHHGVSENASRTKPAHLLAVFVVDSKDHKLVVPDAR
jgi:quercetin dioxygenase-like cupin family protein